MKLADYPKVFVSGAPGWTNFEGWLIDTFLNGSRTKAVVCAEFDGKIEANVFDMAYIEEL